MGYGLWVRGKGFDSLVLLEGGYYYYYYYYYYSLEGGSYYYYSLEGGSAQEVDACRAEDRLLF